MMETRTEYGIVQISEDRFWVTGGHNGQSLKCTEFYDASTGMFSAGPDMPVATRRHSMMKINDTHIVAVGNFDGSAPVVSKPFNESTEILRAA